MKIKIGTRKSKLALVQTDMVIKEIKTKYPHCETEIVHISTKGDKHLDKPLTAFGGKGAFVTEIEEALKNKVIDIAVHSAKDLPITIAEGLAISAVLKRGDYRDVLVTRKGTELKNSSDFIVGTGSLRRRGNMKRLYPAVGFADIRGNVDTRLKKLENGLYDGVILAAAGLERAGLFNNDRFDYQLFDYTEFLPAPCQGIIAVESRQNDSLVPLLESINDKNTFYAFQTERSIIQRLGGDCSVPLGAYSFIEGENMTVAVSKDGGKIKAATAEISERLILAEELISCL